MHCFSQFFKSFHYAFAGLRYCIKTQRNFRFQITGGFYILLLAFAVQLENIKIALLCISIGSVLAAEALNTAIESAVDLYSPTRHPLAKTAKDAAAAAVLLTSFASTGVGLCAFYPFTWLIPLCETILARKSVCVLLAASFLVAWAFVFLPPQKQNPF